MKKQFSSMRWTS